MCGMQAKAGPGSGGAAKKTLAGAVQLFKDLSASAASTLSGRHDDKGEDPEYLQVLVGDVAELKRITKLSEFNS